MTGALLLAAAGTLRAQQQEGAGEPPKADTVTVATGRNSSELLKAKVDSLRQSLAESPERRRLAVARQMTLADSLQRSYDFSSAVDVLLNAAAAADSSQARDIEAALSRGRAGLRMTSAVSMVRVVALGRFSRDDFFSLFPDRGENPERRFHSSSPDGHTLYFSSRDRTGAGGYDLYVMRRNRSTGRWGDPVNMGFPFSSPYDDLLFADVDDGEHSVLVSNRECLADSLNIYVLAYDPVPEKRTVRDPRALRNIAAMTPVRRPPAIRRSRTSVDMSAYTAGNAAVRAIRDSISVTEEYLELMREELDETKLLEKEKELEGLRRRLEAANRNLASIGQSFLAGNGVQGLSTAQAADDEDVLTSVGLVLTRFDDDAYLELEESGTRTHILPEGSFEEFLVLPPAPAIVVRASVPDGDLPWYAVTVIRLHTGAAPSVQKTEEGTVVTAAPVNDRLKAESLRMALLATGVADVSISED